MAVDVAHGPSVTTVMSSPAGPPHPVPTGTMLLKHIAELATNDDELKQLKDAAIYVKGNEITWVGKMADLPYNLQSADQVLDMAGRVVLPGMVNTHHHMFQGLTRCIAQDQLLFGWLATLYEAWKHLKGHDVYLGCKVAMVELIMSGCTCSSDHLYVYPNDVKLEDSIRAARELGFRFHPTRGAMTMSKSKGGMPPDEVCEEEDYVLQDMERLIKEYHDNSRFSMLRMGLAPCAPFNVTETIMTSSAKMARRYPGVRLHTHLAENEEDITFCQEKYGCRPGDYIRSVGWDQGDVWFAHCCKIDEAETKQFAEAGIGIAHCPSSNMRLASGVAPVRRWLDAGVLVGLGVDGTASNDAGHMLMEARLAMLLQRAGGDPKGMSAQEALRVASLGGAKVLGRDDIGKIAPGYAADIVAWRADELPLAGAQHDLLAGLVFCTPGLGPVDISIINGNIIVKDGKMTTCDLRQLLQEHHAASQAICAHIL